MMGIVVAIFVGFRNRNAYAGWWEARTLWGGGDHRSYSPPRGAPRMDLVTINSAQVGAAVGLERIDSEPIPRFYALFSRILAWSVAVVVCTMLGAGGHDSAAGIAMSILVMTLVVLAERIGALLEDPMSDDVFGLPLERFCATLSADLLGPPHVLAH